MLHNQIPISPSTEMRSYPPLYSHDPGKVYTEEATIKCLLNDFRVNSGGPHARSEGTKEG